VAKQKDPKNWPRLPDGTVDWEIVFEHPSDGLIRLIEDASKSETLIECTAVIIQSLFARDSDGDMRAKYTKMLAKLSASENNDVATVLAEIMEILRGIKDNRVVAAKEWAAHKEQQAKKRRKKHDETVEEVFADVLCELFGRKMQVMWAGVSQDLLDGKKIPYTVSSDFASRFEDVVRKSFVPSFIEKCRHILSDAGREKTDDRRFFLENRLDDDRTRKELWAIWKEAWENLIVDEGFPNKPKKNKQGIIGKMKKVVSGAFSEDDDYSMEDWRRDVRKIKKQNVKRRKVRSSLFATSKVYQAPKKEDLERLMNIFAINAGDLRKEISAIRQISEDEETAARAFETYSKGKSLELALIAVSFQDPDTFLREPKLMLPHLLAGKKDHEISRALPLLSRELGHLF
jgi:hypothetical protein